MIGFVSLGCPKALVDSERIITQLRGDGYRIAASYREADLVIVNTCGFIDSAKAESLDSIGEALQQNGRVIVTGCLGTKAEEIRQAHPQVLAVTGPQQDQQVLSAVRQHAPLGHNPLIDLLPPQGIKLTPKHYAYLKISEGCNHRCSFCIIPSLRGSLISRPIDQVLNEAEQLVDAGVKELLVIAQDTSAYGVDLRYQKACWRDQQYATRLEDLCRGLGQLGVWIRLHYIYPYPHVDQVIPLMIAGKILPYLDIPLQHGSPRLLKAMRRPAAASNTLERLQRWRQQCPDLTLRSTFIVGFPGETDEDFELLLHFLEQAQLDRVGCFQYSDVDGAQANALPDHVPAEVKQQRWDRLMQTQARISAARLAAKQGRKIEVLVDAIEGDRIVCRSWADAPEIDGHVYLPRDATLSPGQIARVKVIRSGDYDLWATPL